MTLKTNKIMKLSSAACALGALYTASVPALAEDAAASGSISLGTSGASASGSTSATAPSADGEKPYLEKYKPEPNVWEIGLFGGVMFPSSSHELIQEDRVGVTHTPFKTAGEIGFRLGYFPFEFAGVEVEGAGMPSAEKSGGKGGLFAGRGHLIGQIPNWSVTPFALLGVGALGGSSDSMGTDVDPAIHFGLGAKAAIDEYLSFRLDLRDTMAQKFNADSGAQTHYPEILLGVTYTLERRTPDTDGDGVADFKDACPTVSGTENGCPPTKKPGDPACPEPAAQTEAAPVPVPAPSDADGDGVLDAADKCPSEPAHTADGCPNKDADGDGIEDKNDKCPKEKETANGFKDDDGCPDELPAAVQKFSGVIKGIQFDNNSAHIRAVSRPILDDAAKVLVEYADLRLEITGHTDNTGSKERNTELSAHRAEAVKKYLVEKGVNASRLEAKGMGPDHPIAPNNSDAGRQENRRIEFKLLGK